MYIYLLRFLPFIVLPPGNICVPMETILKLYLVVSNIGQFFRFSYDIGNIKQKCCCCMMTLSSFYRGCQIPMSWRTRKRKTAHAPTVTPVRSARRHSWLSWSLFLLPSSHSSLRNGSFKIYIMICCFAESVHSGLFSYNFYFWGKLSSVCYIY